MNKDRQPSPRYTKEEIRAHRRLVAGVAAGTALLGGVGAAHLADAKPKAQVPVVITLGSNANYWGAAVGYQKLTGNQDDTRQVMDNIEAAAQKQNPADTVAQPGEVIDVSAPANPNYPPDESVNVGGSEYDYEFPDQVPKDAKQG